MKIIIALAAIVLSAATASARTLEEFGQEMSKFYIEPTQAGFALLQADADRFYKKLKATEGGGEMLVAILIWRASEKHGWPIVGKGKATAMAKELSAGTGKFFDYVVDDARVDPGKFDIWWASFFATGEEHYLAKIMKFAGLPQENKEIGELLLIGSASWSFRANCRQHEAVKAFATKCLADPAYADRAAFLAECVKPDAPGGAGKAEPEGASGERREGHK